MPDPDVVHIDHDDEFPPLTQREQMLRDAVVAAGAEIDRLREALDDLFTATGDDDGSDCDEARLRDALHTAAKLLNREPDLERWLDPALSHDDLIRDREALIHRAIDAYLDSNPRVSVTITRKEPDA